MNASSKKRKQRERQNAWRLYRIKPCTLYLSADELRFIRTSLEKKYGHDSTLRQRAVQAQGRPTDQSDGDHKPGSTTTQTELFLESK